MGMFFSESGKNCRLLPARVGCLSLTAPVNLWDKTDDRPVRTGQFVSQALTGFTHK
jgi:hypothetical protein